MRVKGRLYYIFSYKIFGTAVLFKKIKVYKKSFFKKTQQKRSNLVKFYQIISFLNYLSKIIKKLVIKQLL